MNVSHSLYQAISAGLVGVVGLAGFAGFAGFAESTGAPGGSSAAAGIETANAPSTKNTCNFRSTAIPSSIAPLPSRAAPLPLRARRCSMVGMVQLLLAVSGSDDVGLDCVER